ncbi:N-acyl homoserine lactonase family protein [Oceanobacillus polygoni]|uniref:Glyoxylase-like metal-dependent hydrolase (Beta-lactamase superfamily II) n=1 Tax=Oceanobacillus polygoni TaxID=1235259 RepID=A0A9X0YW59_9BACI|nr:N-acyl homoserine lactonase family protein [Oceanobacillus polygoni]MBP2079131.1 glyoxylase-like metal-dependent hydrolase (beta-lactamase superfamily II) [Oceanobacillus polygoni]
MKIHILHTGKVLIYRSLAYKERGLHPAPYTGWLRRKENKMWVPVSSYLIEHPKGLILVDTGWNEDMRLNQRKHLGNFAYSMYKGELPEGKSIAEQLYSLGVSSKELDFVILSHMHSDHVSGLRHVKDAKKILTSKIEWNAAQKKLGYIKTMWNNIAIDTFELMDIPYGPYKEGFDLLRDETLYLVYTPGHSDGMISTLVKMKNGWMVLASDVGYSERSWKEMILPGITTDRKAAYQSLKWLRDFSLKRDCIKVIANHDANVKPQIIE